MSLIENKQTELTAGYLNAIAGTFAGGGVIGPLIATVFGVAGSSGPIPTLTLALGAMIFFIVSVGFHIAARWVLKRLKP